MNMNARTQKVTYQIQREGCGHFLPSDLRVDLPGATGGVRVGLFIGFSEASRAHVRVDLRCCEALVAQKFLNDAQVGTTIQQVRCKTVTQSMR